MSAKDSDELDLDSNAERRSQTITFPTFGSASRQSMQDSLQSLENKRDRWLRAIGNLESEITGIRCCLSPIAHIPAEILSEIFFLACPDHVGFRGTHRFQYRLNVVNVCQRWRDVAYTTPLLWRRMEFKFDSYDSTCDTTTLFCGWDTWLQRATSPLTIEWSHACRSPESGAAGAQDECSKEAAALLKGLVLTSSRWQNLTFHCGNLQELSILLHSSMDSLTTAEISSDSRSLEPMETMEFPQLRSLKIPCIILPVTLIKAPLLTDLLITQPAASEWEHMAAAFPLLRKLVINNHEENITFDDGAIAFPNITYLEFDCGNEENTSADCHIGPLSMPKLNYLYLQRCASFRIEFTDQCVETLEISDVDDDEAEGENVLPLLNSLSSLRYIIASKLFMKTCNTILEALMYKTICPQLSHIHLTGSTFARGTILAFSEIRSPVQPRNDLQVRCLVTTLGCDLEMLESFRDVEFADHSMITRSLPTQRRGGSS